MRAALVRNIKLKKGPLVLHIAGPSGVGKSMTARAVAKSMMVETDADTNADWCVPQPGWRTASAAIPVAEC